MYYVYIVRCTDNTLYTGFSTNYKKRIKEHNTGKSGAKALRGKRPVRLVYLERFADKGDALKREMEIKGWRKAKKERLIKAQKKT